MAVLSAEVMCEILDLVVLRYDTRYSGGTRPSYAELKQLCLVCRSWATYVQYRLFDHVDLNGFDARLAFLRAVGRKTSRGHDLKHTTRTLVLSGPIFRPGGPRDVLDVLSQLPNLETVHVRKGFSLPYIPSSKYMPRNFPAIQSLDIEMNNGSSWETLHDLLRKLSTLQRLAIRDSNASSYLPPIDDGPVTFRLKEFIFLCPWRCVWPAYLHALLESSVGTLEVLGLSMMNSDSGVDDLIAKHAKTLRSLGLDTAENTVVNSEIVTSLVRLEQLTITSADPDLIPALPPALCRLQINTAVFTDGGRPLVDRFTEALTSSLKQLEQLEVVLVRGRHLGDGSSSRPPASMEVDEAGVDSRYAELQAECIKRSVEFRAPLVADDTEWTRFYDLL